MQKSLLPARTVNCFWNCLPHSHGVVLGYLRRTRSQTWWSFIDYPLNLLLLKFFKIFKHAYLQKIDKMFKNFAFWWFKNTKNKTTKTRPKNKTWKQKNKNPSKPTLGSLCGGEGSLKFIRRFAFPGDISVWKFRFHKRLPETVWKNRKNVCPFEVIFFRELSKEKNW